MVVLRDLKRHTVVQSGDSGRVFTASFSLELWFTWFRGRLRRTSLALNVAHGLVHLRVIEVAVTHLIAG